MGEGPRQEDAFCLDCALSVAGEDHTYEAFGYLKIQIWDF